MRVGGGSVKGGGGGGNGRNYWAVVSELLLSIYIIMAITGLNNTKLNVDLVLNLRQLLIIFLMMN